MPSGPSLFDDEDGVSVDRGGAPHEPSDPIDERSDATHGRSEPTHGRSEPATPSRRSPNYLIRRAVVVGGIVAVLVTASVVVGQLIGSGAEESTSGAISADWNRIVLVDDRTGRVVVDDADGEELARIESGISAPTASHVVDQTLVVTGPDQTAVIDVGTEAVDEFELGADRIVNPAGSALTMIAPQTDGGRALLVHGPSGDVIDTDAFAPVVGARYEFADARSSASGRDVLVTDSGNFQSVLFSFDRDEPSFFPGLALAVDDGLVVTAQNVGNDATVNVFDHSGDPTATGRTPSVRAGMITDAGVVLVTVDGTVVTMSSSDGETSDGVQLDIGTIESGAISTSGDRLVVTGANGTAIVGNDAAVIGTYDAQRPAGAGQPPVGSTCIATVTAADVADAQVAVIDVTVGTVQVEASGGEPLFADASGCIVATPTTAGFDLLSGNDVQQFQTDDALLAVSPDGRSIAAERGSRLLLLEPATDTDTDSEESIDLGPRGRTVHFTQS